MNSKVLYDIFVTTGKHNLPDLGIGLAYYRYESGKRLPDVAILTKLADFYNISTDYLLGRSDDPTRH